jgi:hypothetical protein
MTASGRLGHPVPGTGTSRPGSRRVPCGPRTARGGRSSRARPPPPSWGRRECGGAGPRPPGARDARASRTGAASSPRPGRSTVEAGGERLGVVGRCQMARACCGRRASGPSAGRASGRRPRPSGRRRPSREATGIAAGSSQWRTIPTQWRRNRRASCTARIHPPQSCRTSGGARRVAEAATRSPARSPWRRPERMPTSRTPGRPPPPGWGARRQGRGARPASAAYPWTRRIAGAPSGLP